MYVGDKDFFYIIFELEVRSFNNVDQMHNDSFITLYIIVIINLDRPTQNETTKIIKGKE